VGDLSVDTLAAIAQQAVAGLLGQAAGLDPG
jgi:hypothetical protein